MSWEDTLRVLGKDTQSPCGAAALDGNGVVKLADTDGVITWHEDTAVYDRWVILQASGYVNQNYDFRVREPVPESIPTVYLEKYVAPEVEIAAPRDLRVANFANDVATLQWTNGEDYSKVLFRWAVLQPDGSVTNAQQTDLDGGDTSHRVTVPSNTTILFSVKGGRRGGSLNQHYSTWCDIPFRVPVRPALLIHPETKMHPGATVSALVPWGDGHVDLFVTGTDGAVWSTFWPSNEGWVPWFLIHPEIRMHPGATVTAVAPPWGNHIDLFVSGTDGALWSTFWDKKTGWVEWFLIQPEKKMQPGATFSAQVTREGHYDVFATDTAGAVWSTYWEAATGWVPWFPIRPEIKMQPGAPVTALVPWGDGHIDLFVTGTDGAVWSTFWPSDEGWVPWFLIHPDIRMQPGAPITALVPREGHIDLFATDKDGAVWSTFWESATGWVPWFVIRDDVHMQPGAKVSAQVSRHDHIDLFATDKDGAVWSTFYETNTGWVPWFVIHDEVHMQPGATVTPLLPRTDHIDLFVTGTDGAVWSMNWQPDTGW